LPSAEATGVTTPVAAPPKENPDMLLLPPSGLPPKRPPEPNEGAFDVVEPLNENPPEEEPVVATVDVVLNPTDASGLLVAVEFAEAVSTEGCTTAADVGGSVDEPKKKLEAAVVVTVLEVLNELLFPDRLLEENPFRAPPDTLNTDEDGLLAVDMHEDPSDGALNGLAETTLVSFALGFPRVDLGVAQKLSTAATVENAVGWLLYGGGGGC